MITEKMLATKKKDNAKFSLVKVINDCNEMYQFKINNTICWFFKSREKQEDGKVREEKPPFGIADLNYMAALDTLMEIFKVA